MTDSAAPGLNALHARFGDRVRFVMVKVREAHPGANAPQPTAFEEKREHAERLRDLHGIAYEVAVDDIDGTLHRALSPEAELGLSDRDGWNDPVSRALGQRHASDRTRAGRGHCWAAPAPLPEPRSDPPPLAHPCAMWRRPWTGRDKVRGATCGWLCLPWRCWPPCCDSLVSSRKGPEVRVTASMLSEQAAASPPALVVGPARLDALPDRRERAAIRSWQSAALAPHLQC